MNNNTFSRFYQNHIDDTLSDKWELLTLAYFGGLIGILAGTVIGLAVTL